MNERLKVLGYVAAQLLLLPRDRICRIAVDGVDGAGKTFFADELAPIVQGMGRPVIRASVDGFHNPRSIRYRLGKESPRGFFQDSYNYGALIDALLDPLGPEGDRRYRKSFFDHRSDSEVDSPVEYAEEGSLLILDGIFLHRPELRHYWDYSIFLEVGFGISIPRGAQRGDGSPDPNAESNIRYVEGQKLYLAECLPHEHATVIVNNENLDQPYTVSRSLYLTRL